MITSFALALERTPRVAEKMLAEHEEPLRDFLLIILNANYQGLATSETFVGKGKTDILLRWRDRHAFVAECKRWDGRAKFSAGLDQLLGRYTLWRDARVTMVVFIQGSANATQVIMNARTVIREHPSWVRTLTEDDRSGRSDYIFSRKDDLRPVRLALLPIIIDV